MTAELETVVLKSDLPEHGLEAGDVGTIVHIYPGEAAYEVEFLVADGDTIAVLTLSKGDVRPLEGREILHVRKLASA